MSRWGAILLLCMPLLLVATPALGNTAADDPLQFDDTPLEDVLQHPDWFKQSFLELDEDLAEAKRFARDNPDSLTARLYGRHAKKPKRRAKKA